MARLLKSGDEIKRFAFDLWHSRISRFIGLLAIVLVGIIWMIVVFRVNFEHRIEIQSEMLDDANLVRAFEQNVRNTLQGVDELLLFIKDEYEKHGKITATTWSRIRNIKSIPVNRITIVNKKGVIVANLLPPFSPINVSDREYFQAHVAIDTNKLYIAKPIVGRTTGKREFHISRRLNKADGSFNGVVAIALNPSHFSDFYRQMNLGGQQTITLVGRDGVVRVWQQGNSTDIGQDVSTDVLFDRVRQSAAGSYAGSGTISSNLPSIITYRAMPDFPLILVASVSEEGALADYYRRRTIYYAAGLFLSLFIVGTFGFLVRMTMQQEKTKSRLLESEEKYRTLVNNVPIGVYRNTAGEGIHIQANPAMATMFGYASLEEFMGKGHTVTDEYQNPEERAAFVEAVKRNGFVKNREVVLRKKDGTLIWCSSTATAQYDEKGDIKWIDGVLEDITERKRAEEALAQEKERLAVTLRSIGDGVITTDTKGMVVLINKVAETLTGWTQEEAFGRPLAEVFHIINEKTRLICENPVDKVMQTGGIVGLANHTVLIAKDGTERIIADSAAPIRDKESRTIGVVLVFRDTTEKERIEAELLKAQKLESVGLLAGGIAHDFNNLLTAILGNISLVKILISSEEKKIHERLNDAEMASVRAKDLTQRLLTFSGGGAPVRKTIAVAGLIKDYAGLALSGSTATCEFDIPNDLWHVDADEGQIGQTIHNLIINAIQAMPTGGLISIRGENVMVNECASVPLACGKYVKICVTDHGTGIPAEHIGKIFDPYFTTKENGTGLGLATAYSIIKNHEGHIAVQSKTGGGTTFTLFLPAAESEVVAGKSERMNNVVPGRGKILVMDDEEMVRDVAGEILKCIGYDVELVKEGNEAIEAYAKALSSGIPFDLVIMDLTIPNGMGGKEAIGKLKEIDPKVRAIVSSGYSNDPIMSHYREYGFSGIALKPYEVAELSEQIRKVLQ